MGAVTCCWANVMKQQVRGWRRQTANQRDPLYVASSSWLDVFFFSTGSDGSALGLCGRNVSYYKQSSSARLVVHVELMRCEQFIVSTSFIRTETK